jgi:hypothetical protein
MSKMEGSGEGWLGSGDIPLEDEDEDVDKDKDEGEIGERWTNMLEVAAGVAEVAEMAGSGWGGWRWLSGWVAEVDEKWHGGSPAICRALRWWWRGGAPWLHNGTKI